MLVVCHFSKYLLLIFLLIYSFTIENVSVSIQTYKNTSTPTDESTPQQHTVFAEQYQTADLSIKPIWCSNCQKTGFKYSINTTLPLRENAES